jgi:hypothetical protein
MFMILSSDGRFSIESTVMNADIASPLNAPLRLFHVGPFQAVLQPTPLGETLETPGRLHGSLLTRAADLNGSGYAECARAAAVRRPVRLVRASSRFLTIQHAFSFNLPGSALIEQLGLFDDDDRLLFFGDLKSARQAVERPEVFTFEADAVRIMKSRPGHG